MDKNEINSLVEIRKYLIKKYNKCKDYKTNKNAIMREIDYASTVHQVIVDIDKILSKHVNFS